jgi:hypothetical protein
MNCEPSRLQNIKRGGAILAAALVVASAFYDSPTLAVARAQDDPRLASIKERISKTTPRGRRMIEKALGTKLEIFGRLTQQSLNELIQRQPTSDNNIGWEASPKRFGRWRIVLHYKNLNHIQRYFEAEWDYNPKTSRLVVVEPNNPMFRSTTLYAKSYRFKTRTVKVAVEAMPFSMPGLPSSKWLSTVVGRHKYFIDYLRPNGASTLPNGIVDGTGTYIAYASGTGCGYEGEGTATLISDVYGRGKNPILASCLETGPEKFLDYKGRRYLLIVEGNGGSNEDNAFWLYDTSAKRFVIHAKGEITDIRKGVFSYGWHPDGDELKPVGTVTMKNLVDREKPLKLLPSYPAQGLTQRKDTRLFLTDQEGCDHDEEKYEVISKAGTKLSILGECPKGGYEVYYRGNSGTVRKGDLKPIK